MAKCADCGVPVTFFDNLCGDCADARAQSPDEADAALQLATQPGYLTYQLETPNGIRATSVKTGFSWPAFFFGAIWAWVKGMVGVGFGLLFLGIFLNAVGAFLGAALGGAGAILSLVIGLGVAVWIGSSGNEWVRNSLIKKGYQLVDRSPDGEHPGPEATSG